MKERTAQVVSVRVDEPLTELQIEDGYTDVLLAVRYGAAMIGHVWIPAQPRISAQRQWQEIAWMLGDVIWRYKLREVLAAAAPAAGSGTAGRPAPNAAIVVCTRDRPDDLRRCLESIRGLRTQPAEVIVVDNAPSDDASREVADSFDVRYVREPLPGQTRARNRGIVESRADVVAFTDDDCVLDPGWLDDLGEAFADPLMMAVTGYIGPVELDHPAQYLFEVHGGFSRHPEPVVWDPAKTSPVAAAASAGAGANMMFRRELFERVGLFAEDLGPGTPARAADDKYMFYRLMSAGYRVAYDPARIVWHRHRRDWDGVRRWLHEYALAEFAYATRLLVEHREIDALRIMRWWAKHLRREGMRALRGKGPIPLAITRSEIAGAARGPWAMARSVRSRRDIPAIELPPRAPASSAATSLRVVDEPAELSVVIPSRNRSAMLSRVLEAFAQQDHPADRFEVLVLLDGSTDNSAEMARTLPVPYRLRVLEHEQMGAAATRNRGAREAAHPLLVLFDDDIVPGRELLTEHASAHRAAGGPHMALGYSPVAVSGDDAWLIMLRAWWEDHFRRKMQPGHQWRFTDVLSGNVSLPRDLFLDLGGFDEGMTGRREDWELGIRVLARGVRLSHHPRAIGWHHVQVDVRGGLRNARLEAHGDVHLARRHPDAKPLLPLAGLAWKLHRRPERTEAKLRTLQRLEPAMPIALAALDALQAVHDHRRWRKVANRLLTRSYQLGIVDAIPDPAERREFLASAVVHEAAHTMAVWLDRPGPVELPCPVGMVDMSIGHGGRPLVTVPAVRSLGQWDWQTITEQAVSSLDESARLALALAQLTPPNPGAEPGRARREAA